MASRDVTNVRPFGMRDKIGYMFGDFGNDFTFILSVMFLTKFYTDVMGVSPAMVGTMMMASRFIDAFTDIGMGQFLDRQLAGPNGKYKPWIKRIAIPVAFVSFLMYASWFADRSMGFKLFWMFATYILWGSFFYTMINIPYGSMASVISDDPVDRSELSTFRTIGATLAGLVIGVIGPMVVMVKNDQSQTIMDGSRMSMFALGCAIFAVVCYMICYKNVEERVVAETKNETVGLGETFRGMFSSKSLIGIILAALMLLLGSLSMGQMAGYVFPNYFGNAAGQSIASALQVIVILALAPFVKKLVQKYGKKEISIVGGLVGGIALILGFFLQTTNMAIYLVILALANVGVGVFNLTIWAMITDVIDDVEVRTNKRDEGTIYGSYSFARKLGQALSAGIVGFVMSAIGYSQATAFDPNVLTGIYNISTLFPGISMIALVLVLKFIYPLDKKTVDANTAELKRRRDNRNSVAL